MHISLKDVGKRFNRNWLFKHFSFEFAPNSTYALLGPNGSGKSTLLQMIYGVQTLSEGAITYQNSDLPVPTELVYKHTGFAAPALDLIEDFTLSELLHFHFKFKPLHPKATLEHIPEILSLDKSHNNYLRNFSSGMRQRVKLALAFLSNTPLLLLDEPCTNLDKQGISLYEELVGDYTKGRTVIVASNQDLEYAFCKEKIDLVEFKKN